MKCIMPLPDHIFSVDKVALLSTGNTFVFIGLTESDSPHLLLQVVCINSDPGHRKELSLKELLFHVITLVIKSKSLFV